jgi:hypothetical protein
MYVIYDFMKIKTKSFHKEKLITPAAKDKKGEMR